MSLPDSTPHEPSKEVRVSLSYFFRHAGIEEGAHFVYWTIKKRSTKGKKLVESSQASANEWNDKQGYSKNVFPRVLIKHPINEITDEYIEDLFRSASLNGNKENAKHFCLQFINGVLVSIQKLSLINDIKKTEQKSAESHLRFGLALTSEEGSYNFYYSPDENAVIINRGFLERMSMYGLSASVGVVDDTDTNQYGEQVHEQRAMLWQIQDAKKYGWFDFAQSLSKKLKWKRQ